jgi:hypothetical protein
MMSQGVVLWEGPSSWDGSPIVVLATGLVAPSQNRKTGAMVQVFIVRSDVSPMDALRDGSDDAICGACPLRGQFVDGKRVGRACYVNVGQSVSSVWAAYARGSYPRVSLAEGRALLAGRKVRLGAYGDPAMVPFDVFDALTSDVSMWTGYTHQWRTCDQRFSGLLMASADGTSDYREARAAGWRSFVVVGASAALPTGTVECLATREAGPQRQCADCGLCAGSRRGSVSGAVSVAIRAHGAGSKFITVS